MSSAFKGPGGVVVGVDGSEHGYAATRYAATEADRLGVRLDLVHVLPASIPVMPELLRSMSESSLQSYGLDILDHARKAALESRPGVEIETHVCSGHRTSELLACGEHARLIVLGSRSPSAFDRIWTGRTVTAVASSAPCPVVVAPAAWEDAPLRARIAVGVKTPGDARLLSETAFELARELGAELVVLHAWRLEGVYDDIIADRTCTEGWQHTQAALLERDLADLRERFPDVPVRVYVRHEDPAHALVRVAGGVDRVLLQRPAGRMGHHHGHVARAVLREARCPVVVLPEHRGALLLATDDHAGALVR